MTSRKPANRSVPRATPRRSSRRPPLGREAWLAAARDALIQDGLQGVEIGKLARQLGVTRGGFYWFFKSRAQLLDELLRDWEITNNAAFQTVLEAAERDGTVEFSRIVDIWIHEDRYSPAWDAAVRAWAAASPKVAKVVHRVDEGRIALLNEVFRDLGYDGDEAFVRARITYFHQVGYYALNFREPRAQRLRLLPMYVRVLTGR